jgi:hypothetical protein
MSQYKQIRDLDPLDYFYDVGHIYTGVFHRDGYMCDVGATKVWVSKNWHSTLATTVFTGGVQVKYLGREPEQVILEMQGGEILPAFWTDLERRRASNGLVLPIKQRPVNYNEAWQTIDKATLERLKMSYLQPMLDAERRLSHYGARPYQLASVYPPGLLLECTTKSTS